VTRSGQNFEHLSVLRLSSSLKRLRYEHIKFRFFGYEVLSASFFFLCSFVIFFRSQHNQNELNNSVIFIVYIFKDVGQAEAIKRPSELSAVSKEEFLRAFEKAEI
jgi:hypothetical protein